MNFGRRGGLRRRRREVVEVSHDGSTDLHAGEGDDPSGDRYDELHEV